MTQEQLNKGVDLKREISLLKQSQESIIKCLRELELEDYSFGCNETRLKLNSKECLINTPRLIEFLQNELEEVTVNVENKENEFKQI